MPASDCMRLWALALCLSALICCISSGDSSLGFGFSSTFTGAGSGTFTYGAGYSGIYWGCGGKGTETGSCTSTGSAGLTSGAFLSSALETSSFGAFSLVISTSTPGGSFATFFRLMIFLTTFFFFFRGLSPCAEPRPDIIESSKETSTFGAGYKRPEPGSAVAGGFSSTTLSSNAITTFEVSASSAAFLSSPKADGT